MTASPARAVIWRELHTIDIDAAKAYYAGLLGWRFQAEQATRFAWGDGAGVYHLIEAGGEIHGGMAPLGGGGAHWLCYVQVQDVEAALDEAEKLGATVIRAAFDVPGVGVNAVIADPGGARIGLSAPSYDYPYPAGVFLRDHLFTDDPARAASFYKDLFGWALPVEGAVEGSGEGSAEGAFGVSARPADCATPFWAPVLAVSNVDTALARAAALGGVVRSRTGAPYEDRFALTADPQSAVFGLAARA